MVPYMTMHIAASFDHDTINGNDAIRRLVPNLYIARTTIITYVIGKHVHEVQEGAQ